MSSVASVEDVVLKAKGDEPVYVQPAPFERQDMRPRNPRPQHGGHQRPAGNNSQSRPGG